MEFRPKVLVVDDDEAMVRLVSRVLEQMGAQVVACSHSPAAAEEVNREKFDGAVVDWLMPEMDGLQLAQHIRRSRLNRKIPIVMLTGVEHRKAAEDSFKEGVNFFLQKPAGLAQLRHLFNATRGAMLEERRRYQRVPVLLPAKCAWESVRLRGEIVNLSASGALLLLEQPPAEGAEVAMSFTLPDQAEPIRITSRVTRVLEGPPPGHYLGRGVGVEFFGADRRQRRRVIDFVEQTLEALTANTPN